MKYIDFPLLLNLNGSTNELYWFSFTFELKVNVFWKLKYIDKENSISKRKDPPIIKREKFLLVFKRHSIFWEQESFCVYINHRVHWERETLCALKPFSSPFGSCGSLTVCTRRARVAISCVYVVFLNIWLQNWKRPEPNHHICVLLKTRRAYLLKA